MDGIGTGNRTTVFATGWGLDSSAFGTDNYTVDAFNRVTFDGTYHYQYDPEGNRTAKFVDGTPANGTLDSGDTNWTKYTWDHRNRLIRVESGATFGTTDVTVTFGYDWLNRWISTDVDYAVGTDTAEYFIYGGATLPDAVAPWDRAATDLRDVGQITLRLEGNRDFTAGKETADIANRYLWGAAVDQVLADEQIDWNAGAEDYDVNQILWPLGDHLGTVRDLATVNATTTATEVVNTRTYDACGFLINETDTGVHHLFGFTGRPSQTDTGLQNNLGRWYDPEIAIWITEDPISFRGGDANLYRYCGNDPVNSTDPSGLYDGYWTEVGRTAKGYFWNGPCAIVSGVWGTVRHPIDTASGIATAVRHPIQTGTAIKDEIVKKAQTSEGQGEIGFDLAITLTPAGLATKAKLAKTAKAARAAEATRVANATEAAKLAKRAKFWREVKFKGKKVFQRDDLIDPKLVDARGRTNLQRMEKGLAPIGPDGKSMNLHHSLQTNDSALVEMTQTFQKQNTKVIHINPHTVPSGIDRKAFDLFRKEYWMERANDFRKLD